MKFHLIAIGGTGMGALAGLLEAAGHEVRGSDKALYPPMSDQLEALGVPMYTGFAAHNLAWGPDVVVVGNVCSQDHIEVLEAKRRGIPLRSMPQVLRQHFLAGRDSIVVAGTHGKTTTAAILAHILTSTDRDPGFFIGGVPIAFGRGWRWGQGREFLVEGDEYDTAFFDKKSKFLHYAPKLAILTSVEHDHVDIFSSLEDVRAAFREFVALIPQDGLLLVSADSQEAMAVAHSGARCRIETYAVNHGQKEPASAPSDLEAAATWYADELSYSSSGRCSFQVRRNGELFERYETLMVGEHNVGNALAAIAVAYAVGVAPAKIRRALASFAGVKRRQEVRGIAQGVYVLDDYAHHPTAIGVTLRALRKRFPGRRLVAIYEPRTATSRRKIFQREFAEAFSHADLLAVGKLYEPAQIPVADRFDPEKLAAQVRQAGTKANYLENVDEIVAYTAGEVRPGDVVVIMSSGSFEGLHDRLLAALGDAVMSAKRRHLAEIRALLAAVNLGEERVGEEDLRNFLVLVNENGFVGCVCIEVYGEEAILRALAVKKEQRSAGYGWMLADTAITLARHRGVRRVYLLTETASDFFAEKLGFRAVVPSTTSREVADSTTFRNLTDKAVVMRLDL